MKPQPADNRRILNEEISKKQFDLDMQWVIYDADRAEDVDDFIKEHS
jgi:hypothetical protein